MIGPDFSAATWRKSTRSGASNGGGGTHCVEVAHAGSFVGVRDSKHPAAGFAVAGATFDRFLALVKNDAVV
ncbi:DUF397 domain-containing protein [Saccharothrix sp. SC076]|nr:DUF397 domain-containing protein [Saccharothrix obliqua]MBW4719607.1 DUF397 domain-containing protein [Saccharothrix obliqua]